jgi:hypothetical protein
MAPARSNVAIVLSNVGGAGSLTMALSSAKFNCMGLVEPHRSCIQKRQKTSARPEVRAQSHSHWFLLLSSKKSIERGQYLDRVQECRFEMAGLHLAEGRQSIRLRAWWFLIDVRGMKTSASTSVARATGADS